MNKITLYNRTGELGDPLNLSDYQNTFAIVSCCTKLLSTNKHYELNYPLNVARYLNYCGCAQVGAYDIAKNRLKQLNWIQLKSCNENELVPHFQKQFQDRKELLISLGTFRF